jgi:hypothetical protein
MRIRRRWTVALPGQARPQICPVDRDHRLFLLDPPLLRRNFPGVFAFSRPRQQMAYVAILKRIRLLIPVELDGHYNAIRRGFEKGDLTVPSVPISEMQLARSCPVQEAAN